MIVQKNNMIHHMVQFNIFFCGLLDLSIISFKNKFFHLFFWWIFVYSLTCDSKLFHSMSTLFDGLKLYTKKFTLYIIFFVPYKHISMNHNYFASRNNPKGWEPSPGDIVNNLSFRSITCLRVKIFWTNVYMQSSWTIYSNMSGFFISQFAFICIC